MTISIKTLNTDYCNAECHLYCVFYGNAVCRYVECHYAGCRRTNETEGEKR